MVRTSVKFRGTHRNSAWRRVEKFRSVTGSRKQFRSHRRRSYVGVVVRQIKIIGRYVPINKSLRLEENFPGGRFLESLNF